MVLSDRRSLRSPFAVAFVAAACVGLLAGCNQPPALTKIELDAGKLPTKHPRLTEKQKSNCRGCHREQPAIKKPMAD